MHCAKASWVGRCVRGPLLGGGEVSKPLAHPSNQGWSGALGRQRRGGIYALRRGCQKGPGPGEG